MTTYKHSGNYTFSFICPRLSTIKSAPYVYIIHLVSEMCLQRDGTNSGPPTDMHWRGMYCRRPPQSGAQMQSDGRMSSDTQANDLVSRPTARHWTRTKMYNLIINNQERSSYGFISFLTPALLFFPSFFVSLILNMKIGNNTSGFLNASTMAFSLKVGSYLGNDRKKMIMVVSNL